MIVAARWVPGHRPSASALGYALPARLAGFVRRSYGQVAGAGEE
jgi:hypothetical protein